MAEHDVTDVPAGGRLVRTDQHRRAPLDAPRRRRDGGRLGDRAGPVDGGRRGSGAWRPRHRTPTTRSPCRSTASPPPRRYWYQFDAGGERSPVGRTRTLPGRRRGGVPHRDRLLRRLRGGAARRLPRRRRARGRPRAPPRRLHLREGGLAGRPSSRPAARGDDARRLPAPDRPGALRSRRASPPPAPPDGHDLGRPRPGGQRLARRRQGARPRRARTLARPGGGRRARPAGVAARPACRAGTIRSPRGDRSPSATWPSSCCSTPASRGATGRPATTSRRTSTIRSARSSAPSSAAGWPSGWPTTAGRGR